MSKTIDVPVQAPDKDSIDIMASMLNKLTEDEKRHLNAIIHLAREQLERENAELRKKLDDLNEVVADARRLTRELDVAMHGESGGARQAALCDLIEPARQLRKKLEWQPIYTVPNDSRVILYRDKNGNRWSDCANGDWQANGCGLPPIAWMEIPE